MKSFLFHISERNSLNLNETETETSGLYYKTITIVIMMIVSDAAIWSVTYDRN